MAQPRQVDPAPDTPVQDTRARCRTAHLLCGRGARGVTRLCDELFCARPRRDLPKTHEVGGRRDLYGDPRLSILDEPNSNLDDDGDRALAQAVANMKAAKRTVVIVTHRPQIVAHIDRMLVLSFGNAIASARARRLSPGCAD